MTDYIKSCFWITVICLVIGLALAWDGMWVQNSQAVDDEAGEMTFTVLDANNTTDGDIAWKPTEYSSVSIGTSTGTIELDLLQFEYCTLEELANFGCFMQIATELHLFSRDDYLSTLDPMIMDVLVERLISPKLIKENEQ